MCFDPATSAIVGSLALGGGTGLQLFGKSSQQRAYEEAIEAERERQRVMAEEAARIFNNSAGAGGYGAFAGNERKAVADRTAAYTKATTGGDAGALPTAVTGGSAGAAPAVKRSVAHNQASADRFVEALIKTSANLTGANDAFGAAGRSMYGNRLDMGLVGNKAAGSLNVLPVELHAAKKAGGIPGMFGDLLTAAGMSVIGGGMKNPFTKIGAQQAASGAGGFNLDAAGRLLGGI